MPLHLQDKHASQTTSCCALGEWLCAEVSGVGAWCDFCVWIERKLQFFLIKVDLNDNPLETEEEVCMIKLLTTTYKDTHRNTLKNNSDLSISLTTHRHTHAHYGPVRDSCVMRDVFVNNTSLRTQRSVRWSVWSACLSARMSLCPWMPPRLAARQLMRGWRGIVITQIAGHILRWHCSVLFSTLLLLLLYLPFPLCSSVIKAEKCGTAVDQIRYISHWIILIELAK